jgi:hypothetical protein
MATQAVGGWIANPNSVKHCVGSLGQGALGSRKIVFVDFIFAGLDIDDEEFALVLRLDLVTDMLRVNRLAARFDL